MKRKVMFFAIVFLQAGFISCSQKHEPRVKDKTSLELSNLKGKVKSVHTLVYTGFSMSPSQVVTVNYTQNGNEAYKFDSTSGLSASVITTRYDSAGQLTEVTMTFNNKITVKRRYTYDEYGNNSETMDYDAITNDTTHQKLYYTYFNKVSKMETKSSGNKGTVYTWKYEYDDNHFQTKAAGYKNDTLERYQLTRYDTKGNLLDEQWFNPHDTCYLHRTYTYDNAGRNLEQLDYDKSGMNDQKSTHTYDDKGNEISWSEEYYGKRKFSVKYKYEYTYDATGNWIEMKCYTNDMVSSKEVRTIEYYR